MRKISVLAGIIFGFAVQNLLAQSPKGIVQEQVIELKGTIAHQPVLVELTGHSDGLIGRYKYLKVGKIIPVEGVVDLHQSNKYLLKEGKQENDAARPTWRIVYQNDSITGKWSDADQKKTYPIRLGENKPEGTLIDFKKIEKDTVAYSQPEDTTAPSFEYSNRLLFPKEVTKYSWLRDLLRKNNGIKSHQSIEDYLGNDRKRMVEEYQQAVAETQYPEYESWNWDYDNSQFISYNDHDFLTLYTSGYGYTGGAHGRAWAIYDNYDLKNKREVQLSDIVAIDSTEISKLLETSFRQDQGVKPNQSLKAFGLFENVIEPNNNFYFDNWGLTFVYNQYEIGPYVMGIIEVFIPWEELEPYLKIDFLERIGLVKVGNH